MKKTKQTLRSIMATLIVSSMVQSSYAGWDDPSVQQGVSTVRGLLNQYVQARGQQMTQQNQLLMQQAANAQMQQMMSQMKPQMGPAQFFPECPVLQRISNFPENACSSQSTNPADLAKMLAYQSLAQMSAQEYERSSLGSIECISNRQKAFNSQLITFQNRLKALQDQLKQESQIFRDNNQKRLSDMKKNWDDLHGQGSSVDAKTADFSQQFSPTCQSVLKGKTNEKGLVGLMRDTSDDNKAAADFAINRPQIEAEILNETNKIRTAIKTNGLASFDPSTISENYQGIFKGTLDQEARAYSTQAAKLAADIQQIDPSFKVEDMDGTYSDGGSSKINNALSNYKNGFMRKCMAGDSNSTMNQGLIINRSTIDTLITQSGTDGGTAAPGYREAILKILDNDDVNVTLQMKIAQIKELDKTYTNMVFNTNVGGRNSFQSASQALTQLANDCETFFTQPSSSGGMSPQQKGERAQKAMQDLKNAHDALGDKMAAAISSKLIHCNGETKKAGMICNASSMVPGGSSNFCLDTASTCAIDIQKCYGEISAKVGQKTALIKNLGAQYNADARAMVARANVLFSQQKAAVTGLLASIHQKYPGMNFVLPSGKDDPLFISDPAMSESPFGIDLVAGGDMSKYLDELPKKIGSLSELIAKQQDKAKEEVNAYLNGPPAPGLISSLEKQKGKWSDLAQKCQSMIEGSNIAIAEANKKTQEQDAERMKFCKKYDAFRNHPNPSCAQIQALTSDMDKVINSLPGQVADLASQADMACASTNNEGTSGSEVSKAPINIIKDIDDKYEEFHLAKKAVDKAKEDKKPEAEIKTAETKRDNLEKDYKEALDKCRDRYSKEACQNSTPQGPTIAQSHVDNLMGQMRDTPCSGISSSTSKDPFLDWLSAPPTASGTKTAEK